MLSSRSRVLSRLRLTVAAVGVLVTSVHAQRSLQMTTAAAADQMRAIVVAKVLHVDVRAVGSPNSIFTFVEFQTLQIIKGDEPANFTYRMLGGRLGDTEVSASEQPLPRFSVGDEVVLFLGPEFSAEGYPTLMLEHLYRVSTSPSGLKTVTPQPTGLRLDSRVTTTGARAGSPLSLTDFVAALRRK